MFSTCLFCNQSLGSNESLERFPVGSRLAFDGANGRLWVVCTKCGRWNLSPLETRWEAIEEAERLYRDTKKRVATDNVGLARLNDGTDLVRIGAPLLPEFAAWRYGDTFANRQRKMLTTFGTTSIIAAFIAPFGARAIGMAVFGAPLIQLSIGMTAQLVHASRVKVLVNDQDGRTRRLSMGEAVSARYTLDRGTGELKLTVSSRDGVSFDSPATRAWERVRSLTKFAADQRFDLELSGQTAKAALSNLLPIINFGGGSQKQIDAAVSIVSDSPKPQSILWKMPASTVRPRWKHMYPVSSIGAVDPALRLALEMSMHEDDERRAMEGELKALEARWKEAEEIASIADSLTLSATTQSRLGALKGTASHFRGPNRPETD